MARRRRRPEEQARGRKLAKDLAKRGARDTYGPSRRPAPVTVRYADGRVETRDDKRPRGRFGKRLRNLGFQTYEAYLRSDHWKDVWRRYRESGRPMECEMCASKRFHLHHNTYSRLGRERLQDLTPLCWDCHTAVHNLVGQTVGNGEVLLHNAVEVLASQREAAPDR